MHTCILACMHTCIHACMHTCIHTHTYTHTHIHAYRHTYIPTYIHTYIHTYKHTHTHTCRHTYTHTCKHTMHICIHTYIYMYIYIYIYIYIYLYVYLYIYIYIYIYTCIHTYHIHIYIYVYVYLVLYIRALLLARNSPSPRLAGSYIPEGLLAENGALVRATSTCLAYRVPQCLWLSCWQGWPVGDSRFGFKLTPTNRRGHSQLIGSIEKPDCPPCEASLSCLCSLFMRNATSKIVGKCESPFVAGPQWKAADARAVIFSSHGDGDPLAGFALRNPLDLPPPCSYQAKKAAAKSTVNPYARL